MIRSGRLPAPRGEESSMRLDKHTVLPRGRSRVALAALVAVAAASAPAFAEDASHNLITAVKVKGDGDRATVRIAGSAPPVFTVFRLREPSRVVVDLARADATEVSSRGPVDGRGPVRAVTASQFDDERTRVARIVIGVEEGTRYEVAGEGDDLVVQLRRADAATVAEAPPAPTAPSAPAKADDKVVRSYEDALPGNTRGGTRLLAVSVEGRGETASVTLRTDGPVAGMKVLELKEPGRLALDLQGFGHAPTKVEGKVSGPLSDVRIGKHDGHVRVVLEARGDRFPAFRTVRTPRGLTVTVGAAPERPVAEPREQEPKRSRAKTALAEVKSIDVSGQGRTSRVVVVTTAPVSSEEKPGRDGTHLLTLRGAKLPPELARRMDASALDGPVDEVSAWSEGDLVHVAVRVRAGETATGRLETLKVGPSTGLAWTFAGSAPRQIAAAPKARGGLLGEAPAYAMNAGPRANGDQPKYTGKRVDFTAKDLDIIQFLQAIAEVSKRNIVASDDVSGRVSLRLRNVPWDEALDIVLRTKGLAKEEIGSIIRIAPAEKLLAEREATFKNQMMAQEIEPLKVRLIPVNYATGREVADRVKDILSPRGTVSVDERTNVLIVKDMVSNLAKAELLVRNLDTQTPQVLIEARIVEAQTSFTRTLGIQWGGAARASAATGNPTGLVFPNLVSVSGAATDAVTPIQGVAPEPNFGVNLPATVGTNSGGAVGFVFGSAGGSTLLNLRLSAAEVNGTIKTISAPKVTTMDNTQATIGQGISIPFSQVSAAGVNTMFVEARLSLDTTPHVTADGSILLRIRATNNQPNPQLTGANGQPSISRREATTNVLVKDGETTVIGGIYTRRSSLNLDGVPYLSRIPVLGTLFRKRSETEDRTELLIFITPRIVNRQASLVSAADAP